MLFQACLRAHRPRLSLALSGASVALLCACNARAQDTPASAAQAASVPAPGRLTVHVDRPGVKISPLFYGLMTEEINHAYDGGLYAELVQNRALKDDPRGPSHWSLVPGAGAGSIALDTTQPVPGTALSNSLRLDVTKSGAGVANDGYWGIPARPGTTYQASFYARGAAGFSGPLMVSIESNDGARTIARGTVPGVSEQWKKYSLALPLGPGAPSKDNRLVIRAGGVGSLWLTQVSLMPPTFNNRPNGLRPDLMRLLGGLKPSYLRFPGGNYLEGNTIAERFDWKKTLGPIEERPGHQGPWGYRSTDGMGMMEFLLWCEDLKMEPLLAVFAGYALGGEHIPAGPGLEPFIQDALDEIEYVSGPATSTWGARRAADGHPAPFKLRYVEIGNEDWFDRSGSYDGRFAAFHDAIKKRYPQLQTIATMPVRSRKPDVIDDHYYRSGLAMAADSGHYDSTDRSGPKIFVGEWASTEGSPTPTWQAAMGDAAWLTGLERNSDHVIMQCYAPGLVNVNPGARQWGTNLIGYDALSSYGSPSYWVQAVFGANTGDTVLSSEVVPASVPLAAPTGKVGVGTWNTQAEFKDIRVVGANDQVLADENFAAGLGKVAPAEGQWAVADGVLRQNGAAAPAQATLGDDSWGDYTLSLKARKLGGAEGFLILFHARDAANYRWWNIGGWGNTRSAIERAENGAKSEIGRSAATTIEVGRWYDVRVEVRGASIRCFLDGKLVNQATDAPAGSVYAAASRDTRSGEVILKVVNFSPSAQPLRVELQGAREVSSTARAQVLVGQPGDVNSIEEPRKVAPRDVVVNGTGRLFTHEFPPYSVSVMRLRARP